ncbi:hypothetical protein D187_007434 [Cystobacter fuscus DSM 2262]|uniref:Uncharacterized protein n=1 Tax=Cystobacter fuscus (strain ATCC 25194 / DSM 2262 / NBRC 100088 / M29) TaxID=1242864 RepID=S9P1G2_CYSF2|nr:hypothetical protein [Cystobacter fuscus]EPX56092.1 hypothetical protein D187_007434 [Cystobacter fuscus DSM 2262]
MSSRHEIKLKGPVIRPERIPAPLFHDLLHIFVEGAQRALRLRVEGRSTARGTQPAWMRSAAQFDLLIEPPSEPGVFRVESRPLRQVLPANLRPGEAPYGLDLAQTAVDLFEEGLEDALAGATDSDTFDEGLVETFSAFARLFEQGVEAIEIVNGRTIPIDTEGVERVIRLRRQIPAPQAVRIAGTLDTIRHSDRVFTLMLESGAVLKGVAERLEPTRMASLFGKQVVVSGMAVFRPSGSVSRIDVEQMQEASAQESALWSRLPRPLRVSLDTRSLRVVQDDRSGLNAIYGQWPGDESEEELVAALEELS